MKRKTKLVFLACATMLATSVSTFAAAKINKVSANETRVFEMVDGASIRVIDPTGIRFKTKIDATYYEELTAENTTSSLNVAIIPYVYYENYLNAEEQDKGALYEWLSGEYGAENILSLSIPANKIYQATVDNETAYYANAVMSNVYFNNYNVDFVGAAYIQRGTAGDYTYQDVTGITEKDNVRSIFEVAYKAAQNPVEYVEHGAFLDDLIEKGMYNAYGVKYDNEATKYVYENTEYDTYESMKAGLDIVIDESTLSLGEESAMILKSETKQFVPTFLASNGQAFVKNFDYVWSSSDETVATVNEEGKVTPVKAGTTTITVSAVGGRFTSSCVLTIKDDNVFAQSATWVKPSNGITVSWDESQGAYKFAHTTQYVGFGNGGTNNAYTSIDVLERSVELGYSYAELYVKVDDAFLTEGTNVVHKVGIYANIMFASKWADGTTDGWRSCGNSNFALYEGEMTAANKEWTKILLDLTKIESIAKATGQTLDAFSIHIGGPQNSNVWFKDFKALTETEYNKAVLSDLNVFSQSTTWVQPSNGITVSWDESQGAYKFAHTTQYVGFGNGGTNNAYISIENLKKALNAGYKTAEFYVKVDDAFLTEGTNVIHKVGIYANIMFASKWADGTTEGWRSCGNSNFALYEGEMTEENKEWTKITLDLTKIESIAETTGQTLDAFSIHIGGPQNSNVWFKDFKLIG